MDANSCNLFLYRTSSNLCYGYWLQQLTQRHTIKGVNHPLIIKQVGDKDAIEERSNKPISDDPEEGKALRNTNTNCNYGMLDKQIHRT